MKMEQERMTRQISQDNTHVELEILQRTLKEKTLSLSSARESMQHLQESFASHENEFDAAITSLCSEKDALQQQILELEVSSKQQIEDYTKIEQDKQDLEQTCTELMEMLEATEGRCTALQYEEEAARRLAADSQAQIDVLSGAMKAQLEILNVKIHELGMDVQERENELVNAQVKYESKNRECEEYVEEIKSLAAELASYASREEQADVDLSEAVATRKEVEEKLSSAEDLLNNMRDVKDEACLRRDNA